MRGPMSYGTSANSRTPAGSPIFLAIFLFSLIVVSNCEIAYAFVNSFDCKFVNWLA
jgi:hypothetical protein